MKDHTDVSRHNAVLIIDCKLDRAVVYCLSHWTVWHTVGMFRHVQTLWAGKREVTVIEWHYLVCRSVYFFCTRICIVFTFLYYFVLLYVISDYVKGKHKLDWLIHIKVYPYSEYVKGKHKLDWLIHIKVYPYTQLFGEVKHSKTH